MDAKSEAYNTGMHDIPISEAIHKAIMGSNYHHQPQRKLIMNDLSLTEVSELIHQHLHLELALVKQRMILNFLLNNLCELDTHFLCKCPKGELYDKLCMIDKLLKEGGVCAEKCRDALQEYEGYIREETRG